MEDDVVSSLEVHPGDGRRTLFSCAASLALGGDPWVGGGLQGLIAASNDFTDFALHPQTRNVFFFSPPFVLLPIRTNSFPSLLLLLLLLLLFYY